MHISPLEHTFLENAKLIPPRRGIPRTVLCLEGSVVLTSTLGKLVLEWRKRLHPGSCEHCVQ